MKKAKKKAKKRAKKGDLKKDLVAIHKISRTMGHLRDDDDVLDLEND